MPVRDLCAAAPRTGVTVLANRGAAGIDGTVSTAVGAALAWQRDGGGPAFALIGDLTFLHDAGGLLLGPDEPRPDLTIVVVDNDGGGIFGLLEQGGALGEAAPTSACSARRRGADLAALCGASGTAHTRVELRQGGRRCGPGPASRACRWSRCAPTGPRPASSRGPVADGRAALRSSAGLTSAG